MRAKKSLGQNFLKSKTVVQKIVSTANLTEGDTVLEIGPGRGALTEYLLLSGAHVIAVELDDELIPYLQDKFQMEIKTGYLKLVHADVLALSEGELKNLIDKDQYKFVANIPYYITGEIIRRFLSFSYQPHSMTLLVQKEVAQRIVARDNKESILSMSVKCYGVPKYVEKVPARVFNPVPKVDSAILYIGDISKKVFVDFTEKDFFTVVKQGFAQKRKKLLNNLSKLLDKKELMLLFKELEIDENIRAEKIGIQTWSKITKRIFT